MKKQEEVLQIALSKYMKLQYPGVIFRSDFAAGCKLSIWQAVRNQQMQESKSYPDFFIAHPKGIYHGMYLELKKEDVKVYRKDGKVVANEHIQNQHKMLVRLRKVGYYADFAIGFDDAKKQIDCYMSM